ncbi:hypothetical protein [Oceanicoccus sp. KOV_DT_Chl]|uniref:hypothetical protein n=1 Tax=Oceanicoccus sp. KOV_DT_Chl TaxID=1904639 RepID=UPI00135867AB|nr:hypothetical protein [Oceanicoccus sp. KOV_DT_Chl]
MSTVLFVTACGGGGGGGGNISPSNEVTSDQTPILPDPLVPTARFEEKDVYQVASTTYNSVLATLNLNDFSTGFVSGFAKGLSSSSPSNSNQQQFGPMRTDCAHGGYSSLSYFLVDISELFNGQLQDGDSLESSWNNCHDVSGFTFNGGFNFEVNEFSGDFFSGQYILDIDYSLINFSASYDYNQSFQVDGSLTSSVNTMSYPAYSATSSGNDVRIQSGLASILKNFSITINSSGTGSQSIAGEGFINSSVGGDIKFTIVDALEQRSGENVTAGTIVIEGDNNSSILLSINSSSVEIEMDLDGDSIYEDSIISSVYNFTAPLDAITVNNASYISEDALEFAEGMHYMIQSNVNQFKLFVNNAADAYAGNYELYTVNCQNWGDTEFDFNFADSDSVYAGELATGDKIIGSWNDCSYPDTQRYSGSIDFEVVNQTGNFNTADYEITFEGSIYLSSPNNNSLYATNYQFTLTEIAASDQQVHFTSDEISFGVFDSFSNINVYGTNTDGIKGISGTGSYIAYDQIVSVSITDTVTVDDNRRPNGGTIIVTDPHGSTITISPLGDNDYQLDVDIDGDESIDSTFIKNGY